jgi:hypothetical protein
MSIDGGGEGGWGGGGWGGAITDASRSVDEIASSPGGTSGFGPSPPPQGHVCRIQSAGRPHATGAKSCR